MMQDGSADIRVNLSVQKMSRDTILRRTDKSYATKAENLKTHFSFASKFWSKYNWLVFSTE